MTREPIPVPRTWRPGRDIIVFVDAVRAARPGHLVWHAVLAVDPATTAALGLPETDWRVHAIEFDDDELVFWAQEKRRAVPVASFRRDEIEWVGRGMPASVSRGLTTVALRTSPSLMPVSPIPHADRNFPAPIVTIRLRNGTRIILQLAQTRRREPLSGGIKADEPIAALHAWLAR